MRVLMLSTDQNILKAGSEAQNRMIEYGRLVEELHIIVRCQALDVRFPKIGNVVIHPARLWQMYATGKKVIKSLSYSSMIITCQDPFEIGLIGYWLKRKFKLPLQLQIHTDFLSPYFWKESWKNKIRVLMGKALIKKADGIRVVSERLKKSLLTLGYALNPIYVLPIFVDAEKIKNSPINADLHKKYPDYDFIILMSSRLTKEKNIKMAIEAFSEAISHKTEFRSLLLIVGEGPERKNLESRIVNYELSDNVKIEPWTDDLVSYYKTADLFLLTSNYEGYGRTAVEAQAAGLPVLMTDVGVAIGEVAPVGDKAALVAALSKIMDNSTT